MSPLRNRVSFLLLVALAAGPGCNTSNNRPVPPGWDADAADAGQTSEPDLGPALFDAGDGSGPDLPAPAVTCVWVAPAPPVDDALVYLSGSPDLSASCTHADGMQGVQFFVDDELFDQRDAPTEDTRYDTWLDTTPLADGEHTLRVIGYALSGEQGEAEIVVQVDNTPPTIVVEEPAAGSEHIERMTVSFTYEDASGIAAAQFEAFAPGDEHYVLNEALPPAPDEDGNEAPWLDGTLTTRFDIAAVLTGDYELTLSATDIAGNERVATLPVHIVTTPRFRAVVPHETGAVRTTEDIDLGDYDGDGVLDLFLVTSRELHVLPGRGDGSFGATLTLAEEGAELVRARDLDGDGISELVLAANWLGENVAVVFQRDGEGAWAEVERHTLPEFPTAMTLGRVDDDDAPDIVLGGRDDQRCLSVLLGVTGATEPPFFENTVHTSGGVEQVSSVTVARIDEDDDFGDVVAGQFGGQFSVFPGYGDGGFNVPRNVQLSERDSVPMVAAGDLTGDGVTDLAAIVDNGTLFVYAGEAGDAEPYQFGEDEQLIPFPQYSHKNGTEVLFADVDADGDLDILTVNYFGRTLSVWENDGAGGMSFVHLFNVGLNPARARVGDLDGDGLPEIVLLNLNNRTYTVLMNRGGCSFAAAPELLICGCTGQAPVDLVAADLLPVPGAPARPDILVVGQKESEVGSMLQFSRLRFFESDGYFPRMPKTEVKLILGPTDEVNAQGLVKDVRVADVDGDGDLDVGIATETLVRYEEDRNLNFVMGPFDTTGGVLSFAEHAVHAVSGLVQSLALCDTNGDVEGDPDLVLVSKAYATDTEVFPRRLSIWGIRNVTGALFFDERVSAEYRVLTSDPIEVQCGLINEDAANDFLAVTQQAEDVNYFKGNWEPEATYGERESLGVGASPRRLVVADVNADGANDAIVTVDGDVAVLFGTGSDAEQTFDSSLFLHLESRDPYGVTVKDFNFDGWPDIAVADKQAGTLSIFVNSGEGDFTLPAVDFTTSTQPTEVVSADFNGDSCDDVAVLTTDGRTVTLLLSEGARCTLTP